MTRYELLSYNCRHLDHAAFIVVLFNIADAIDAHPDYRDYTFPTEVPNSAMFRELGKRTTAAVSAAQFKDTQKEAELLTIREEGQKAIFVFSHWAEIRFATEGRTSLVSNLAIDLKPQPSTRSTAPRDAVAPSKVQAKQGKVSGTASITTNRVPGTGNTEIQICTGDPTNPDNWITVGHHKNCRNMLVTGLTPGQEYHFRVRCLGGTGWGPWSAIVTLRVI